MVNVDSIRQTLDSVVHSDFVATNRSPAIKATAGTAAIYATTRLAGIVVSEACGWPDLDRVAEIGAPLGAWVYLDHQLGQFNLSDLSDSGKKVAKWSLRAAKITTAYAAGFLASGGVVNYEYGDGLFNQLEATLIASHEFVAKGTHVSNAQAVGGMVMAALGKPILAAYRFATGSKPQAVPQARIPAQITGLAGGAVLTTDQQFTWDDGNGVNEYFLIVGTTLDPLGNPNGELHQGTWVPNQQIDVNGIPGGNVPVYVKLLSRNSTEPNRLYHNPTQRFQGPA
jgi:hypothetical protein